MEKCQACGSEQLSIGTLISRERLVHSGRITPIYFRVPDGKKAKVMGIACSNCGHLELNVNQEKLQP